MAEYYTVLKRAIDEIADNRAEVRRAVYGELRNALIAELKAITPPLPTADILRRRIELEEAIRKVEREATTERASGVAPRRTVVAPPPERKPLLVAPRPPAAAAPQAPAAPPNPLRRALHRAENQGEPPGAAAQPEPPPIATGAESPSPTRAAAEHPPSREPIVERAPPAPSPRRPRETPPARANGAAATPAPTGSGEVGVDMAGAPARSTASRAAPLRLVPTPIELGEEAENRPSPQELFRRALEETENRAPAAPAAPAAAPPAGPSAPVSVTPPAMAGSAPPFTAPTAGSSPPLSMTPPPAETAPFKPLPAREAVGERAPAAAEMRHARAESPAGAEPPPPVPRALEPAIPASRRRAAGRSEPVEATDRTPRRARWPALLLAVLIVAVIAGAGAFAWSKRTVIGEIIALLENPKPASIVKPIPPAVSASPSAPNDAGNQADGGASPPSKPVVPAPTRETDAAAAPAAPAPPDAAAASPPGPAGSKPEASAASANPAPAAGSLAGPPAPAPAAASDDAAADDNSGAGTADAGNATLHEEVTSGSGATDHAIKAVVSWRFVQNADYGPSVEADLLVPERHMKIRLTIHKNTDAALPASHLVEVSFATPADLPGKGIERVGHIFMKSAADVQGKPLAGASVKVADGLFWIALSAADNDVTTNLTLLRQQDWIDIPFSYTTGQRAILTFEKGTAGDQVLQKALSAWTTG